MSDRDLITLSIMVPIALIVVILIVGSTIRYIRGEIDYHEWRKWQ